jgi:DNA-binding MarR family transcriptional regulator
LNRHSSRRRSSACCRLTPADGTSLTAASTLRRLEQSGPHRLCDLAVAEGVTQPAMTQLVSRLERGGLATRGGDPADGRVVVVRITAAGRELLRRRRAARADRLSGLLADLDPADRAAIVAALPALDRLGGARAAR